MPKMIDLGYMYPDSKEAAMPMKMPKRTKEYPTCWIRKASLPIKPTDVGKTLTVTAQIHITGIEERTHEDRGPSKEYQLEIRGMALDTRRSDLKNAIQKVARR